MDVTCLTFWVPWPIYVPYTFAYMRFGAERASPFAINNIWNTFIKRAMGFFSTPNANCDVSFFYDFASRLWHARGLSRGTSSGESECGVP